MTADGLRQRRTGSPSTAAVPPASPGKAGTASGPRQPSAFMRLLRGQVDSSNLVVVRILWGAFLLLYITTVLDMHGGAYLYHTNYIHNSELLHLNASAMPSGEPEPRKPFVSWNFEPYEYPGGIIASLNGHAIDPDVRLEEYTDSNAVWAISTDSGFLLILSRMIWSPVAPYATYFANYMSATYVKGLAAAKTEMHVPNRIKFLHDTAQKLAAVVLTGVGIVPSPWLPGFGTSRIALVGFAGIFAIYFTWIDPSVLTEPISIGGVSDLHLFVISFSLLLGLAPGLTNEASVNVGNILRKIYYRIRGWGRPTLDKGSKVTSRRFLFLLRLFMVCVYFFSGVAKLNYDWLIRAEPVRHWLIADSLQPEFYNPFYAYGTPEWIGELLKEHSTALYVAWAHVFCDFSFALLLPVTSGFAFQATLAACWLFHALNGILFGEVLGRLPLALAIGSLVFADPSWPRRCLTLFFEPMEIEQKAKVVDEVAVRKKTDGDNKAEAEEESEETAEKPLSGVKALMYWLRLGLTVGVMLVLIAAIIGFPARQHYLSSDVCWTGQGLPYSWGAYTCEKWCKGNFTVLEKTPIEGSNETEVTSFQVDLHRFRPSDEKRVPFLIGNSFSLSSFARFYRSYLSRRVHQYNEIAFYADVQCSVNFAPLQQFTNKDFNMLSVGAVKAARIVRRVPPARPSVWEGIQAYLDGE